MDATDTTDAGRTTASGGALTASPRAWLSFGLVGSIGFLIEATILTTLTQFVAWTPWQARLPSFVTAVLVTWVLNRRHTFANRGLQHRSLEALFYAVIQGGGAIVNLAIFGVCLWLAPQLSRMPVIPLAIGAIGGFVFNFFISGKLLYARLRPARDADT